MTYTVKNGTWCKDNAGEYFSCTRVGLIAAQAAGEIPNGTKVVLHERRYDAGQLVDSFNPNPPEGCFVPDGSAFDTSIYTELAAIFPDGYLPDLRECALVMVGQRATGVTNHDVYTAGQFKDDQAAVPAHTHEATVTDPGHSHTVTDAGHDHDRGTMEIKGSFYPIKDDNGSASGAFEQHDGSIISVLNNAGGPHKFTYGSVTLEASRNWTGRSETVTTGVSIDSGTTGISVSLADAGSTGADTTHGKQVGVYRYIAF